MSWTRHQLVQPLLLLYILSALGVKEPPKQIMDKKQMFILYDVNRGEGFNLRRDVYMRVAIMVRRLNIEYPDTDFTLVLPPWGPLYHWQTKELGLQAQIPWSLFFDISSLAKFVPVLELGDFLMQNGLFIDQVYNLQAFDEVWTGGKFVEKFEVGVKCLEEHYYQQDMDGSYSGLFWYYRAVRARRFACMSVQGAARLLNKHLAEELAGKESILLDRAEHLLHEGFGDATYWGARRSMRFAGNLVQLADEYRATVLSSDDVVDDTIVMEDWREENNPRKQRGGQYMCVHLRRKDYVHSRAGQIPSIYGAATQLTAKLAEQNLTTLFVATDAPDDEFHELVAYMDDHLTVVRYVPTEAVLDEYMDGGVAIIDQLVCSHARYFVGSYESTFTFRIQEEREIMGFLAATTFDMLCPDHKESCDRGIEWKINWGDKGQDWSLPPRAKPKHEEL